MPQLRALPEPGPGVKPRAGDAAGGKGGGKGELAPGERTWDDPDRPCLLSLALILGKIKEKLM